MSALTQLIDRYLDGGKALRQAVAGMTREQLLARPVAGKWSTQEVVCHIADFEPVFVDRMKRIIALDQPTFFGADENRFAAELAYHDREPEEELRLVVDTRSQMARILRRHPESVLERVGVHNEKGPRRCASSWKQRLVTSPITSSSWRRSVRRWESVSPTRQRGMRSHPGFLTFLLLLFRSRRLGVRRGGGVRSGIGGDRLAGRLRRDWRRIVLRRRWRGSGGFGLITALLGLVESGQLAEAP